MDEPIGADDAADATGDPLAELRVDYPGWSLWRIGADGAFWGFRIGPVPSVDGLSGCLTADSVYELRECLEAQTRHEAEVHGGAR